MTTQIVNFSFGDIAVSFRADGFLNATAVASHFGKQPRDYLKTESTQEYIAVLAEHLSNKQKILIDENQLVVVKNGSAKNGGGTWLHPKLAIHFARWLNPKFAVWCDEQIENLLSGSLKTKTAKLGCLTLEQQDEIKKFHRELVQSAPKDKQAALAIGLWSAVKTKFGVGYKQVAEAHYPEVLSLMARVAVEKGAALSGEVLDKEALPSESEFKALMHLFAKLGTYTLTLRDLQKNLMLKPENLSYWFSSIKNTPEEGFLFFFNPDINRDLDDAANIIRRHKHLIA